MPKYRKSYKKKSSPRRRKSYARKRSYRRKAIVPLNYAKQRMVSAGLLNAVSSQTRLKIIIPWQQPEQTLPTDPTY